VTGADSRSGPLKVPCHSASSAAASVTSRAMPLARIRKTEPALSRRAFGHSRQRPRMLHGSSDETTASLLALVVRSRNTAMARKVKLNCENSAAYPNLICAAASFALVAAVVLGAI
jgi:hypothetical protein